MKDGVETPKRLVNLKAIAGPDRRPHAEKTGACGSAP